MGCCFGRYQELPLQDVRIVMLGLDNSGKTTLFNLFQTDEFTEFSPTVGYNTGEIIFDDKYNLCLWDIGGKEEIRPLWDCYYSGKVDGLIYVVDISEHHRFQEAKEEMFKVLESRMLARDVPVLFVANKSDLINEEVTEDVCVDIFQLSLLNRPYKVIISNGMNGEGLSPGVEWILQRIESKNQT